MYSKAIIFMTTNMAETVYKLYMYVVLREAIRMSKNDMLSLMGMIAAQLKISKRKKNWVY